MSWKGDEDGGDPAFLGKGRAMRATEKALLVELDSGEELWIPKSVIHDDSEIYESDHAGKLIVKLWWASQEGLDWS